MSKTTPKLLLVEQDSFCASLLAQSGFELTTAEKLSTALEKIKASYYDLILMGLSFPDGSGLSAFNQVHSAAATPVVVLAEAAERGGAVLEDAMRAGGALDALHYSDECSGLAYFWMTYIKRTSPRSPGASQRSAQMLASHNSSAALVNSSVVRTIASLMRYAPPILAMTILAS